MDGEGCSKERACPLDEILRGLVEGDVQFDGVDCVHAKEISMF